MFVHSRAVAEDRVRVHELEGMARSKAVGPRPSDQVARLLRSYRELAKERAELKKILNELNRVLGSDE